MEKTRAAPKKLIENEDAEQEEVAVVTLTVPQYVSKGEDAELECHWRVPRLYSFKWYFNDVELFALMPGEVPSRVLHSLPGLRVDVSVFVCVGVCWRGEREEGLERGREVEREEWRMKR